MTEHVAAEEKTEADPQWVEEHSQEIEQWVEENPQVNKIVTPVGDVTYWAKWIGNVFVIIGVLMTGADLYPWNLVPALIGNVLWGYVGALWNDRALVVLQSFLTGVLSMSLVDFLKASV